MEMNEYQRLAHTTAVYPTLGAQFVYPVLGLAGEAGEISEKTKKIFRDSGGVVTPEIQLAIKHELGDVLWYVAEICSSFRLSLDDVATANIIKLKDREKRGKIQGDGDNR